jgi:hypothetical protein
MCVLRQRGLTGEPQKEALRMQLQAGLLIKWIVSCRGHALWLWLEAVVCELRHLASGQRHGCQMCTCCRAILDCEDECLAIVALLRVLFRGIDTCPERRLCTVEDSCSGELTGFVPGAN